MAEEEEAEEVDGSMLESGAGMAKLGDVGVPAMVGGREGCGECGWLPPQSQSARVWMEVAWPALIDEDEDEDECEEDD